MPEQDPIAQNQTPVNPNLIQMPHFDVAQDNQPYIPRYEDPTDPTFPQPAAPEDELWDYTRDARKFFGKNEFAGRRMIGRDSPIEGGVYTGTYGGEAIVVDPQKRPQQYDKLFNEVSEGARGKDGKIHRSTVLKAAYDTVSRNMKYSQKGVDNINREIAEQMGDTRLKDGTKIDLSEYMQDGVGVCRHQALATAWVLEKMKKEGHIRGQVSVDRNMNWNPKGGRDGHAWVRYTTHDGTVMILDVAQGYFGTLEDSEGRKHGWDYMRPEEKRLRTAQQAWDRLAPPQAAAIERV